MMKKIIPLFILSLLLSSCDADSLPYRWIILENNSDVDLSFSLPYYGFYGIDDDPVGDTTRAGSPYNIYPPVEKHNIKKYKLRLGGYENWIDERFGYYPMFIVDHCSVVAPENIVCENDRAKWLYHNDIYMQRYDLTYDDMLRLRDSKGILRIVFPPDDRMKSIKMWPPYGTYEQ